MLIMKNAQTRDTSTTERVLQPPTDAFSMVPGYGTAMVIRRGRWALQSAQRSVLFVFSHDDKAHSSCFTYMPRYKLSVLTLLILPLPHPLACLPSSYLCLLPCSAYCFSFFCVVLMIVFYLALLRNVSAGISGLSNSTWSLWPLLFLPSLDRYSGHSDLNTFVLSGCAYPPPPSFRACASCSHCTPCFVTTVV